MTCRQILLLAPFLLSLLPPPPARGEMEVSAGLELSRGRYGGERPIDTTTVPVSLAWYGELLDLRVEGSFIRQDDPSVTTTLYGSSGSPLVTAARYGGPGGAPQPAPLPTPGSTPPPTGGVSGPGDIILRGGYIFAGSDDLSTRIRGSLFVKLPTASAADALGTGKVDVGGGIDLSSRVSIIHLVAELGYTVRGRVDGFALKNSLSALAGGGIRISDRIEPMITLRWESPPSAFSGELVEIKEKILWEWDNSLFIDLYLLQGVTRDATDQAGGVTIGYRFP